METAGKRRRTASVATDGHERKKTRGGRREVVAERAVSDNEVDEFYAILHRMRDAIAIVATILLLILRRRRRRLPPSPTSLPILGHLHLQLDQVATVVVSFSRLAHEVLKTHDAALSSHPQLLSFCPSDVTFSPAGGSSTQPSSSRRLLHPDLLPAPPPHGPPSIYASPGDGIRKRGDRRRRAPPAG